MKQVLSQFNQKLQHDELSHSLKVLIGPLSGVHEAGEHLKSANIYAFYFQHEDPAFWFSRQKDFEPFEKCIGVPLAAAGGLKWEAILARLPSNWFPDVIIWRGLLFSPPLDIADCPCPLLFLAGDWQLVGSSVVKYAAAFDYILGDKLLIKHLQAAGVQNVGYWPTYSFSPLQFQANSSELDRSWDVSFVGNLRATFHTSRNHYLYRLTELSQRYRIRIDTQIFDERYLKVWQQTKIAVNHSLRSEMNLRAYEATASGAMLMQESSNLEIQEFLAPGECCVLYDQENFEDCIDYYLRHPEERMRIAANGAKRIQSFSYHHQLSDLLSRLPSLLQKIGPSERRWHRLGIDEQGLARLQAGFYSHIPAVPLSTYHYLEKHYPLFDLPFKKMDSFVRLAYLNVWLLISIYAEINKDKRSNHSMKIFQYFSSREDALKHLTQAEQELESLTQALGEHPVILNNLIWTAYLKADFAKMAERLERQVLCIQQTPIKNDLVSGFTFGSWQSSFQMLWQSELIRSAQDDTGLKRLLEWNRCYATGLMKTKLYDSEGAEQAFRQAISYKATLPEPYFALAFLMKIDGKRFEAIEAMRMGLSLGVFYIDEWILFMRWLLDYGAFTAATKTLQTLRCLFQSEHFSRYHILFNEFELLLDTLAAASQLTPENREK